MPALCSVLGVWPVPRKVVHEAPGVHEALLEGGGPLRVFLPPLPHTAPLGGTVSSGISCVRSWELTAFPGRFLEIATTLEPGNCG